MGKQIFEKFGGGEVTDDMLEEASQLFSENYGVWGKEAAAASPFVKPGKLTEL